MKIFITIRNHHNLRVKFQLRNYENLFFHAYFKILTKSVFYLYINTCFIMIYTYNFVEIIYDLNILIINKI